MRNAYLLDTNHLGAAVNPVSLIRERLYRMHRQGAKLGTCLPVLCELEAGIQGSPHVASYRRQLAHLMAKVRVWPLELPVAPLFGELYHELQRRGRVLSQVDIMLAALVRQMNLTLLTSDRDFEALPEIRTENWLNP
jgi:tRNA(fMet)-specific endonuclease VapC